MDAMRWERDLYGSRIEILRRDVDCTVYRIADGCGDVIMTSYAVFPGIELIYNDVHTQQCTIDRGEAGDIIEINHCREGRIECEFKDEFFYLSQGDVAVSRKADAGHDSYFPGGHYHGITIMINSKRAPDCLSCLLDDVNVQPVTLAKTYCDGDSCFVMRAKPSLAHIFSELYHVPESIRKGYHKVKVLEALLFLSSIDPREENLSRQSVPKSQVALAKDVCRYLSGHMDSRITIEQISGHFHVSPTQVKNSFKRVYGTSLYAFAREQKMREAGSLLRKTDDSILDIAGQFGYDNGSKFAKAFAAVMGMRPSEYRAADESLL